MRNCFSKHMDLNSSLFAGLKAGLLSAAAYGCFTPGALAQENPQQFDERDVIIVTAQKKEGRVLETPISITAFSQEALEKGGLENTWDLQAATPGLLVGGNVRAGQLYLRGIGSDSIGTAADGSTTVHLDGVYLARPEALLGDFIDVERVEVLKGPQGTLYGRNSVGGTVNLISRAPTEDFTADASILYGNYNRFRTTASVSGPIVSDRVLGRAAILKSTRDGYVENSAPTGRRDFEDEDLLSLRGSVLFRMSDNVDLTVSGDYTRYDDNGVVNVFRSLDPLLAARGGVIPADPFVTNSETDTFEERRYWGFSGTLVADLGGVTLKSITAYRDTFQDTFFNTSQQAFNHAQFAPTTSQDQFSQELQLASDGSEKFQWLAGLYYFQEKGLYNPQVNFFFNPRPGPTENNPTFLGDFYSNDNTKAYAAFVNGSYDLTDRLQLEAGLRYSYEEKDHDFRLIGLTPGAEFDTGVSSQSEDWDDVSPKIGLNYSISDNSFLYASYSRGFKSGGFDAFSGASAVNPEHVRAFELGSKNIFADGRLTLNLAGFKYDYDDLQVNSFDPVLIAIRSNAASARVKGIEVEAVAYPAERLRLEFGLAWLDAKYTDFLSPPNAASGGTGAVQLAGNSLRNAPELSLTGGAEYVAPLKNGGSLSFRLDGSYQSEVFYTQFNTQGSNQEGYGLLNARAAYVSPDEDWELSLFAQNITNKHYFTSTVEFGDIGLSGANGNPRTYGVKLKWNLD